MSNINTFIRLRPPTDKSHSSLWDILSPTVLYSLSENKHHIFSLIHGPKSSTSKLFTESLLPLLQNPFKNQDLAIVTTGPKSSGKSFTLFGSKVYPGLIYYTLEYIFEYFSSNPGEYLIGCSFIEIYKENFFDLISGEYFEDPSDSRIRKQICVNMKQVKSLISVGNARRHEDCHCIFTLNLEALQDELKVIIIRFFDFQGIDSVDSEKNIRPFRQILLLKQPKNRIEKAIYYLLCKRIAVIMTLAMDQSTPEIFSTLKFLDRLRTANWDKEQKIPRSTLSKLKRKLEKIKEKIQAHPDDSSLEVEFEHVKSKIIFTDSASFSIDENFEPGIQDIKEVKVLQGQMSIRENFNFDIMDDPCLPMPHEKWIKLIVEQDFQLSQLRYSIAEIDQENSDLVQSLKDLKCDLEELKRNAFNFM